MTASTLVGRDRELARIDDLLAGDQRTAALVVRGPRGVGVSALLAEAASRARAREMLVLRAAGVPGERDFPYAGLHQLMRPLRRRLELLPAAQREALEASFDPAAQADRFRVGLAALALLSAATQHGPVLVCVDEAQWVDRPTLETIGFIARRLEREPVALVAGAHTAEPLADLGLPELALAPLAPAAAAALLDASAPDLDAFARERVLRAAEGNPLALTELPRALADAGDGGLHTPLTPALADTFGGEAESLPADARALLRAAALDDGGRLDEVVAVAEAVSDRALSGDALQPAVEAGLVALAGDRVVFDHGLVRAAVRQATGAAERRRLHAAWATVAGDRSGTAVWHRVLSAAGPDDALASELEQAGARILADGDHLLALEHLRQAARLTPGGPLRDARLLAAADVAGEVGARRTGARLLAEVAPERLDPAGAARLAALSGPDGGGGRSPAEHARDAAQAGEHALAQRLAWQAVADRGPRAGSTDADALVALARETAGPAALASILSVLDARGHEAEILAAVGAGLPGDADAGDLLLLGRAALLAGDPHSAARLLDRAAERLREQGRLQRLGEALALVSLARVATGDLDRVARPAQDALRFGRSAEQPLWGAMADLALGIVAAVRGDKAGAEHHAAAAERAALPARASVLLALVQRLRATAALAAGRPGEAFTQLLRLWDPADPAFDATVAATAVGDLAEAATGGDERAQTAALLAALPPSRAPQLRLAADHARLVLAADADAEAAFLAATARAGDRWPLEDARMLLAHGMRLRRMRRVAESRAPLREARSIFAALGASPWAERAARELAATTETANRSADGTYLTPQELEIARMAARGMTNRAIADQLALSPRTVGAHLSHIYPKLGIAGRAGLADALAALE